ncbi:MAG: TlpA family protein disulfide reductase [Oscillospiraceae bacterium]|nr:TlpA family protein disulfide reductase [Oscillospiraceae bacterium]
MKRILIAVVLAVLTVSVLCSCGKSDPASETAVSDPAASSIESPDPSDETVTDAAPAAVQNTLSDETGTSGFSPDFSFETTDRDGNTYNERVFSGHKLTIVNFWEPWCGPCVREMPDLQELYTVYSDKGLNIIGIYSTPEMEENVDSVLRSSGITFSILNYTDAFDEFQTGYVPTTILVDGSGHIVGETLIGSRSYAAWEAIITEYLS